LTLKIIAAQTRGRKYRTIQSICLENCASMAHGDSVDTILCFTDMISVLAVTVLMMSDNLIFT
jgi:hypothetical protein